MWARAILLLTICGRLQAGTGPAIATVSTEQGVWINKVNHSAKGVPSWPLVQGDEIRSEAQAVVISAPDGSRYTLSKHARVRVFKCSAGFVLQVLEGELQYKIAAGAKVELCALAHPIKPLENTEGTVTVEGEDKVTVHTSAVNSVDTSGTQCPCVSDSDHDPGPGWFAAHKVAILVVAGTAAAVGTTLGLTLPGATSPSVGGH